jgi:hypothetical protein
MLSAADNRVSSAFCPRRDPITMFTKVRREQDQVSTMKTYALDVPERTEPLRTDFQQLLPNFLRHYATVDERATLEEVLNNDVTRSSASCASTPRLVLPGPKHTHF